MPQAKSKSNLSLLFKQGDILLVAGLFGTVMLMILPIRPFFLDAFLAVSIALSLLILLSILYVKEPAEFTGFPTLLLFITLYRLSLNIASTRLILLNGYAGHIIETFGNFVVRGNYVVGLVIFLILAAHLNSSSSPRARAASPKWPRGSPSTPCRQADGD